MGECSQSAFKKLRDVHFKALRRTYLTIVKTKFPSELTEKQFVALVQDLFGTTQTISIKSELEDEIICCLLTKANIEASFLETLQELERGHSWFLLTSIEKGRNIRNHEKYKKVHQELKLFAEKIEKMTVTIREAKKIAAIDSNRIIQAKNLLSNVEPDGKYTPNLNQIKCKYNQLDQLNTNLSYLFEHFLYKSPEFSETLRQFKEFSQELPSQGLKNFQYPQEFSLYEPLALNIGQIRDSELFDITFNNKVTGIRNTSEDGALTLQNVLNILNQSLEYMEELKQALSNETGTLTVQYLVKVFQPIATFEGKKKELNFLTQHFKFSENLSKKLESVLVTVNKINELKDQIQSLLAVAKEFEIKKDKELDDLREIDRVLADLTLPYDEMLEAHKKGREITRPLLDKEGIMDLINKIIEYPELREFTLILDENQVRAMLEMLDDYGNTMVKPKEVTYLFHLINFYRELQHIEPQGLKPLVQKVRQLQDQFKTIAHEINTCGSNLGTLRQLTNKGEATKGLVRTLMKEGEVIAERQISNYSCHIKPKNSQRMISVYEAIEMRDRIQLSLQSAEIDENFGLQQKDRALYEDFIFCTDNLENFLSSLQALYSQGSNAIDRTYVFDFTNKQLERYRNQMVELKQNWQRELSDAYKTYYPLTFYHARQFALLAEYLDEFKSTKKLSKTAADALTLSIAHLPYPKN